MIFGVPRTLAAFVRRARSLWSADLLFLSVSFVGTSEVAEALGEQDREGLLITQVLLPLLLRLFSSLLFCLVFSLSVYLLLVVVVGNWSCHFWNFTSFFFCSFFLLSLSLFPSDSLKHVFLLSFFPSSIITNI